MPNHSIGVCAKRKLHLSAYGGEQWKQRRPWRNFLEVFTAKSKK
jgi:hypothetical protein